MDFFELVALLATAVGIPAIVLFNIRKMVEARSLAKSQNNGSALRTSELEVLIEDAVQRAVRPLMDRIEGLDGAEQTNLLNAPESPVLGDEFGEFDDEELVSAGRARTRA